MSDFSTRDGTSPTPLLSDDELRALTDEYDQLALYESPADFAQVLTRHESEPWLPYRHLMYINDALVRLADPPDPLDRLLVTVPFRHG